MASPFLKHLIVREVVESTNDLARELAAESRYALPLAVRAGRQTNGRGRGTHAWWSDAGSLTFTLLLDPAAHGLRPEHEPRLALATAVAIIHAVAAETAADALGIRWPNDIEWAGRKLAGILPERVETPRGARIAVGIGLNVLTRFDAAPADVRRLAASLAELPGTTLPPDPLDALFHAILAQVEVTLPRLADDDPALAARWNELDLLRDQWVRVDLGSHIAAGLGRGIDPEGALRLSNEREVLRIVGGQVLRDDP